nr:MAG TPA: hypothetical protein [Caudoviricetes sp.]DAX19869.1 MAG TPA: hypothetical protein [Caudoviricetes sp.]
MIPLNQNPQKWGIFGAISLRSRKLYYRNN